MLPARVLDLNVLMPVLTRRRDPDRADYRLIHYGHLRVGTIGLCTGNPNAVERWEWSCGPYPGNDERLHGTERSFMAARVAFERAWRKHLPRGDEMSDIVGFDTNHPSAEHVRTCASMPPRRSCGCGP